jgi:hypothetical protein
VPYQAYQVSDLLTYVSLCLSHLVRSPVDRTDQGPPHLPRYAARPPQMPDRGEASFAPPPQWVAAQQHECHQCRQRVLLLPVYRRRIGLAIPHLASLTSHLIYLLTVTSPSLHFSPSLFHRSLTPAFPFPPASLVASSMDCDIDDCRHVGPRPFPAHISPAVRFITAGQVAARTLIINPTFLPLEYQASARPNHPRLSSLLGRKRSGGTTTNTYPDAPPTLLLPRPPEPPRASLHCHVNRATQLSGSSSTSRLRNKAPMQHSRPDLTCKRSFKTFPDTTFPLRPQAARKRRTIWFLDRVPFLRRSSPSVNRLPHRKIRVQSRERGRPRHGRGHPPGPKRRTHGTVSSAKR